MYIRQTVKRKKIIRSRTIYRRRVFSLLLLFTINTVNADSIFTLLESDQFDVNNDWPGLNENKVFFRKFKHIEANSEWSIKIGKGGQIYSIKLPRVGEIIANQRSHHGQWIDEVFQHTIPMKPQKSRTNIVVDGDIHQAGYYTKSDLIKNKQLLAYSIYSPMFRYYYDADNSSINYIIWPQHAHLPRVYSENLVLLDQTISDLGSGVIEVAVKFSKWGGKEFSKFSLPFSAFRKSKLPVHIVSTNDGRYQENTAYSFRDSKPMFLTNPELGGWIALVTANEPSALGIGFVFGKLPQNIKDRSYVRWGNYGPPKRPEYQGTVLTVKRNIDLLEGEVLFYKYYVVLGSLSTIQITANKLVDSVQLEKFKIDINQAEKLKICEASVNLLTVTCDNSQVPLFYTYKDMVHNSKPLFLMKNNDSGEIIISNDPYEISFDPTNGKTKYIDFLGWSLPESEARKSNGHIPIEDIFNSLPENLMFGNNVLNSFVVKSAKINDDQGEY